MSNLIAAFRVCMFAHKDLWDWLNDPTAKKVPKPQLGCGLFSGYRFGRQDWSGGEIGSFRNRGHVLKKADLGKRMRFFPGIQRGDSGEENYFGQ